MSPFQIPGRDSERWCMRLFFTVSYTVIARVPLPHIPPPNTCSSSTASLTFTTLTLSLCWLTGVCHWSVCVCLVFINQTNVSGMSVWLLTWSSIQHICHFATHVYSSYLSPRWPGWQHLYFSHHSDETNSLLILPALIWVSWHTSLFLLETVLYCLWMNQRVHEWKAGVAGEMLTEVIRSPPLNVMLRCYSTLQHNTVNACVWVLQRNNYQDDCDLHKMHEWQTVSVRPQTLFRVICVYGSYSQ
jgi:hypothetical protein